MPRIMISAMKSGSGKTTITCGLLQALKDQGLQVNAFKCGPDYIDPMFHRKVLGIPSGNLDCYFTNEEWTSYLLKRQAEKADITVLEGAMGYYDGRGGSSFIGSAYDVARITKTPVILVVDAMGASVTLAAMVKGVMDFREDSNIQGILLNRVSEKYYPRIKGYVEEQCHIPVLGYLPNNKEFGICSRHLGLCSPEEIENFSLWSKGIGNAVQQYMDIDGILAIARNAKEISLTKNFTETLSAYESWKARETKDKLRVGMARDEAFSFYYQENIDILEEMNFEICYFSPLHDKKLPENLDGIILWGGYPEHYAKELSENQEMRRQLEEQIHAEIPCIAECGGFLYLQKTLEDVDGIVHEMVGALPGHGFKTKGLCRFGYGTFSSKKLTARASESGISDFEEEHEIALPGHEFHHWDCTENGRDFVANKENGDTYECMIYNNHMMAGFPHFYYYSNIDFIRGFREKCMNYHMNKKQK